MSPVDTATSRSSGAPQIDPRMRDRWIRARRDEGRRRLRWMMAAGGVVVLLGVGLGIAESPLLSAEHVTVSGATHETAVQVAAAGDLAGHPALFTLGTGSVAHHLETRLPWVASAKVSRHWPDRVSVTLHERTAVAVVPAAVARSRAGAVDWGTTMAQVAAGAGTLLVDGTGRVLATADGQVPGLPVLLGIADPPQPGGWLPGAVPGSVDPGGTSPTARLLQLAADVPAVVSVHVTSLQLNPDGTLAGTVTVLPSPAAGSGASGPTGSSGGGTGTKSASAGVAVPVVFGEGTDLPSKVVALQTLLADVDLSGVTSVDVSDPQRAYLTGNPQPSSLSTTAGG